jgi:hydroxypyruvate reductase/glycerate 2-kinase
VSPLFQFFNKKPGNHLIKNKAELASTDIRKQALDIIEAGISRVMPAVILKSALTFDTASKKLSVNGDSFNTGKGRIFVIGGGKASGLMAKALEEIIGTENITAGIVTCKTKGNADTRRIKIAQAGHPLPDKNGLEAVQKMLALKETYSINEDDLVLCLISGGGSALMPCPVDGITLEDKRDITDLLMNCGADINEINLIRKRLSRTKGGQLGQFYAPATVVSLILSDVIGNKLDIIASGQTYPDTSTFADASRVLEKYHLMSKAPTNIIARLQAGEQGEVRENPKALPNCHNYIIGDNHLALQAMSAKAKEAGLAPYIVTAEQNGTTGAVAELRAREIQEGKYNSYNAIIIGGETTPSLPPHAGKGGRNQHYAAISMSALQPVNREWVLASIGTDGVDFLNGVAGAIVDNNSLPDAIAKGIDVESYLDRYDSNTLFKKMEKSLIMAESTGTNVGDITIYILK